MIIRVLIITLNLTALSGMMVAEIIRPGLVSGTINMGWVWLGAVISTTAALRITPDAKTSIEHQNTITNTPRLKSANGRKS